ncbi:hypothetical protein DFS33DRAFT_1432276 [Desarmillaria ectypa]|nr:hypothetical protein DFS33DRAFT_1432276 [Desarmillaria ectypa]
MTIVRGGGSISAKYYIAILLHRVFNKKHSDRLYTTEDIASTGWKLEGDAARIYDFQATGTTPFYRMYSPTAIDHFYTTDKAQWKNAINNRGYNDEGIAGYIYPSTSQVCGGVPFYRMYRPNMHDHFYTTHAAERDNAVKNGGHQEEQIADMFFLFNCSVSDPSCRLPA